MFYKIRVWLIKTVVGKWSVIMNVVIDSKEGIMDPVTARNMGILK